MHRPRTLVLAAITVAGLLLGTGRPSAQASSSWACAAIYYATCYAPAQVHRAEHVFHRLPVNPSRAVYRATRLRLTRVTVTRPGFNRPPNSIYYIYGLPLSLDQPFPKDNSKKYVVVIEYPFHLVAVRGVQLNSSKTGTRLIANFPRRGTTLMVDGNLPAQTIKQIGLAILSA